MLNKSNIFIILCIAFLTISCAGTQTPQLETYEFYDWLSSKKNPPDPRVKSEGIWNDDVWGESEFKQDKVDIKGSLGGNECIGRISGDMIYILVPLSNAARNILESTSNSGLLSAIQRRRTYGGDQFYTVVMKRKDDDTFAGAYNYRILTRNENDGIKFIMHRKKE
ncbi:MAG: hypothetical protein V1874_13290 [Spirochaetota bacterium]